MSETSSILTLTCVCVCVTCVCVTCVCAGQVDQLSEDSQQQVEDRGEDGDAACRTTQRGKNTVNWFKIKSRSKSNYSM